LISNLVFRIPSDLVELFTLLCSAIGAVRSRLFITFKLGVPSAKYKAKYRNKINIHQQSSRPSVSSIPVPPAQGTRYA
jgi:hypothetical protein